MNIYLPNFRSLLIATGAAVFALIGGACSPSALFGNPIDNGVKQLRSYHTVNPGCSNLNLSSSRLDVVTGRQLVACLNAQGALGGFAKLVQAMTDDELAPFINSLNRSFLDNPDTLFKLRQTLNDLDARKELDSSLESLGDLLSEDDLITHSLSIFRQAYLNEGHADPLLLAAAQRLSSELTEDHVADAIDLGILAADSRAFSSLWSHLYESPRTLGPEIAEGLVTYGRSASHIGLDAIDRLLDGSLFELIDKVVPDDAEGLSTQVPRWNSILDASLADSGLNAGQLGRLFAAQAQPISCMQGARALRYPPLDVIQEMVALPSSQARGFIDRDKLSELYAAAPLCSFPAAVTTGYHALMRIADGPAIEPLTDILRSAYQVNRGSAHPVAEFAVNALSDPGFQDLLPALSELQARGAYSDVLLLSTLIRWRSRSQLTYLLQTLVDPLPGAPSSSIYDVLAQGFALVAPDDITTWLQSFRPTRLGLASALRGLRAAYSVNDVHPLLDLLRGAMADAPNDPALLEALLKISARPEFQSSLRELSAMSADGRLKELMNTTLTLFERYSNKAQSAVHALAPGAAEPPMRFLTRHSLAAEDLNPWKPTDPMADFGACQKVDLSVRWDQLGVPGFEDQLGDVAACVQSDGQYKELSDSLRMLSSENTDPVSGGPAARSFHALLVEAYDTFQFTKNETSMLADWMLATVSDGRMTRVLQALPVLLHQSLVQPLIDLATPIINDAQARLGLKRLGLYGASLLEHAQIGTTAAGDPAARSELQKVLAYADDLYEAHPPARAKAKRAPFDQTRILRWISNKECTSLTASANGSVDAAKNQRLHDILDEYDNAVINHGSFAGGGLRHSWNTADLKQLLAPVFKKFADIPNNGPLARALTHFAARFNDPKQFAPGYLEQWLRKRANDRRIISYFYDGETKPRVRVVNGLDRLALLLINGDIYAGDPIDMNFGMQFLAEIADAWGDVPFEQRPPEIQKKYPASSPPETLAQAVSDISDTVTTFAQLSGYPALPQCKQVADPNDPPSLQQSETTDPSLPPPTPDNPAPPVPAPGSDGAKLQVNIFNIVEILSVLQENVNDGGLQVIRDLFFDLYYTGPTANQDPGAGLKNNLSVATYLVKAGLLRQVGLLVADTPADDPTIHGFFQALQDGASSPEIGGVAESLFGVGTGDTNQQLLWNILDSVLKLQAPADIAMAKSVGLDGMAALDALGHAGSATGTYSRAPNSNAILTPLLHALAPILTQYNSLIIRHADLVGDFVTWPNGSDFLRALAQSNDTTAGPLLLKLVNDAVSDTQRGLDLMETLGSLDSTPQAIQAWSDLRSRWNGLDNVAEFQALHLKDIGRDLLNLAEARDSSREPLSADQTALTRKLLSQAGTLLERNNMELVDQILALSQRQPKEVYDLVESLSGLVDGGQAQQLLNLINTKLGNP